MQSVSRGGTDLAPGQTTGLHIERPPGFRARTPFAGVALLLLALALAPPVAAQQVDFLPEEPLTVGDEYQLPSGTAVCGRTIRARVVAIDQVLFYNRLMVFMPSGQIFALERDVVPRDPNRPFGPGNARLRPDKRPRPLVLRMNVGDCLEVTFTNLLARERVNGDQPATRTVSLLVDGLSLVGSIDSAGANVGANTSSLASPGETRTYTWFANREGPFHLQSGGAMTGGEGNSGQTAHGLFGSVIVEPKDSIWYRSQLTQEEMDLITVSTDAAGNRIIDYDTLYPLDHPDLERRGQPVVKILDATDEIFHNELTAIITNIPDGTYPPVTAAAPGRDRNEPFRELVTFYHDEQNLVQSYQVLEDEFFAHSVRDTMAINYGTGGVGAEIISYGADEIVGAPTHVPAGMAAKCNDCKFEDAFLSSWAVGDPAMIFERADPTPGMPDATGRAIQALYPDDPSNVHHSYLNDHVKMRLINGGVYEHHIHHLHAHQWLHQGNSDNSTYFDSQAIGPGSAFTLDIVYNGSGNRNKTAGDSIFHCHFYPHFAQGMWALWRVHDVFEDGTRTLPDAELAQGTPVPGVVPIPGQAMAPPPSLAMPGYPFYIPGAPGHRPPHPPMDTPHDGGLPRHVVLGGKVLDGEHGPFDRSHLEMDALALPEAGTALEQSAMAFHAQRTHASVTPEGLPAEFITNGRPPVAGAPWADPCVDDVGLPTGTDRTIKGAVFQLDAVFNKAGWHFNQWRMTSHWDDVADFQSGARAPEPFFMRARSGDCITYHHTNLVPNVYQADDFQVFTPTDIIGQHIHLVKFDVMASDGSANGWSYEDGTFSPDEVIERINAINALGGLRTDDTPSGARVPLTATTHPVFGVLGAQTTIQRWWADPLLNALGEDRTIRTVFTHDHYGPSTHQQAGLYSSLLIEPAGSDWRHPETGVLLGQRADGGPSSWRADILMPDPSESYREFMLMSQDFHLAYTANNVPINPPGRREVGLPHIVEPPLLPSPEAISASDVGTMSVNYRNEPLALRLRDPATNLQAANEAGDPAYAYSSDVARADPQFDRKPLGYADLTADVGVRDPFTPIMRAYEGDRVQIRFQQGATEEDHHWSVHGLRWKHDPADEGSMYKNSQMNGISEQFTLDVGRLPVVTTNNNKVDFLYLPGASVDDQWNGNWGLLREYQGLRGDLLALPSNPDGALPKQGFDAVMNPDMVTPQGAPIRSYDVTAVRVADALPGGTLVFNEGHGLNDPTALMYVLTSDLRPNGKLLPDAPHEPLILRANAGDHIKVILRNGFAGAPLDLDGFNYWPLIVEHFNANQVAPSSQVGLHPQLVQADVGRRNGVNAGYNGTSTVGPGEAITYHWYAGKIEVDDVTGAVTATPVEFGATNLMPADPLKHSNKGLVGALVIEPQGSTWAFPDPSTRAVADVTHPNGVFREFVLVVQDDITLRTPDGNPVPPSGGGSLGRPAGFDPEDSANKALNYRTEPMWTRLGFPPGQSFGAEFGGPSTNDIDFTDALSIAGTGPIETPLFVAKVGTPIRFRVVQPGGHPRNTVFTVQGHMWRHEPGNPHGELIAAQAGHGPSDHWDIVPLHGAGGAFGVPGDYLYRNKAAGLFDSGQWGIFRVVP